MREVLRLKERIKFPADQIGRIIETGNTFTIRRYTKGFKKPDIVNVDKDHYMDNLTGELREKSHTKSRDENTNSLKKTFSKIRDTINTNVTVNENCLFVTLTYKQQNGEPMTDCRKLYKDFSRYWKRLKRYLEKNKYDIPEYIAVAEPQASGAWHLHVIYIWKKRHPFIANAKMSELWKEGFTKTTAIGDVDSMGTYLTAYLTDIPVEESEDGDGNSKRFVKGGRLKYYPTGFNIMRASRGIKKPVKRWIGPEEIQRMTKNAKEVFHSDYVIFEGNSEVNRMSVTTYKKQNESK